MKNSIKKGFGFGLTSGIITTLGMIMGLEASTGSAFVVIGGIITIAIADAFSDALGVHISEESNKKTSHRTVWESTFSTLIFKFLFAITFIVPFLLLTLQYAIILSIIWGILLLSIFSFYIASERKVHPLGVIAEHLLIALIVIIITFFVGRGIARVFT
jgi:VIT1/CCC1 family predicted Fe2+/Mn2+ transporter